MMPKEVRELGTRISAEINRKRAIERYYINPNYCLECERIIEVKENEKPSNTKQKRFCNSSCAAKYNNVHRFYKASDFQLTKDATCVTCKTDIEVDIRTDTKKCKCIDCNKKRKIDQRKGQMICEVCGDEYFGNMKSSTCSNICTNQLLSKKRSLNIIKNGTSNPMSKQEPFSYKFVNNIMCDSNLEKAAIIYLVDVFMADNIKRFKSLLSYYDGDINRRFNPDFYVTKDELVYIVEVKMNYSKLSQHQYNKNIPQKKLALQKFCCENNYNMIQLDFSYDSILKRIYNKIMNDRKKLK